MTVCHTATRDSTNGESVPTRSDGNREGSATMVPVPQIILSPVARCDDYSSTVKYQMEGSSYCSSPDSNRSIANSASSSNPDSTDSSERHPKQSESSCKRKSLNKFLPLPIKTRSRHVSFEDTLNNYSDHDHLELTSHINQNRILKHGKSTHSESNAQLVRNEYSDSPIFVRKHQVEDFRCSGVRMSITSLCDSVDVTSRPSSQRHLSSLSSYGSYTCLPAVTITTAHETCTRDGTNNQPMSEMNGNMARLRVPTVGPQRRRLCSERRLSAFEVLVQEMAKRKESCQQRFCQIYVLLVILQISLGLAISAMAIYLPLTSSSIQYRDATIWSGVPLAMAGVVGVCYHMIYIDRLKSRTTKAAIHRVIFIVMSLISTLLCAVGCVTSGVHGTKIAHYVYPCKANDHLCVCFIEPVENDSITEEALITEDNLNNIAIFEFSSCKSPYGCCDLVFTNIKDCMLLECAFNCIGCCISVWLIAIQWKNRPKDSGSSSRSYSINQY